MNLDYDILSNIKSFLTEDYIYFAPVSKQWNIVWGNSPRKTRKISEFTTIPQICQIVKMDSSKNKWFHFLLKWKQLLLLLIDSNIVYVNHKLKNGRCFICNKRFDEI